MLVASEAPCNTVYYNISSSVLFCIHSVAVRNGSVAYQISGLVYGQLHQSGLPCTHCLGAGRVRHWIKPVFPKLCFWLQKITMDPHILADLNIGVFADPFWLGIINTDPQILAQVYIVLGIQN